MITTTIHIPNMIKEESGVEGLDIDASAENYKQACILRLREVYGEEEEVEVETSWTEQDHSSSPEVNDLVNEVWDREAFEWVWEVEK